MWLPGKLFFLLLLVYTQSWAYPPTDTTKSIRLNQLPAEGLLLDKGWSYMPGDNPEWASPGWNDHNWLPIDPTQDIHDLPALWQNNIGWFRLRFSLDSTLRRESLALLVDLTGASEIYLNGRLIGKYGKISLQPEGVRGAHPAVGEFISLQPEKEVQQQVLAVRFALQKDIPYVVFAGRYNRAVALRVLEMQGVTQLMRGNTNLLDYNFFGYIQLSIFSILALLHLVLFYFSPERKANLYFFIYSSLSALNFFLAEIIFHNVQFAATRMYLLIFCFLLFTSSCFFFLVATYSIFKQRKSLIFWLLATAFIFCLPLFLWFYKTGWLFGLMLFPILTYLESARITFLADRKKMSGARIVTYGAIAFLVLYPLALAFIFGLLPAGPNGVLGHLTFNLAVLGLPVSLSIYLATEASFTSRTLEAKLMEVQELSEKTIRQEQEKRQLQEMNEFKSRFFANISHEFRTPLSIIQGTVEKLRKKDNAASEKQADYQTIDRNAGRLLQMINQMLDLSRLEAGKLTLHQKPADLSQLLKVLGGSFTSLFESKGITYRYTVPLQPLWVEMDSHKLEQIINNLLSNAAKFTPAKGEVSFTATVHLSDKHTGTLQLKVQDTGIGIPAAHLPRIFERFYQADSSATRQYEGTGIGLALVKELVELHGGQISAESTEGKGSTISVQISFTLAETGKVEQTEQVVKLESLPLAAVMANEEPGAEEPAAKNVNHHWQILVVEDNADLRHFIAGFLSDNYKVQEAENGLEGYRLALETIPDLIISDLMMPELDGISLCRKLKEDERTSHIPVILLTAKADAQSKISGLETGADDYLTKPFSAEELRLRVQNLIRQRQQLREKYSRSFALQPAEVNVSSVDEQFLQKVLAVMEENISNADFDVDAFSRAIGMSRAQLNRKLNALLDQSPNEFIRLIRLKRAAHLLQQNQGNVGEVAFMVGFSNPNYFTKCFRDLYGVAPSEYLQSVKATQENKS
jgi:signal transduction histidine kinase/DNA-binding response OmpR family regulator